MKKEFDFMKKPGSFFFVFLIFAVVLTASLYGCGESDSPAAADTQSAGTSAESQADGTAPESKTFTADELASYTGKDGTRAYIAVDGIVYDVTDVPQWKDGGHVGGKFQAGKDYTDVLKNEAPHGISKMEGIPVVGTLVE